MATQQKQTVKYGYEWPPEANELNIELACYKDPMTYKTGRLVEEHFKNAFRLLWPQQIFEWNDWMELMVWAWCNYNIISVMGHASAGKCHGKDTPILMFDGSVKFVQDIVVGDLLMGDDSTPRRVLSTCTGKDPLYRVLPTYGDPWVCNESHILSLKASYVPKTRHGRAYSYIYPKEVIDVPLKEYLNWSNFKKGIWRQYRVGVEFSNTPTKYPVDPYIYGAWLADGGACNPIFHKPEGPMVRRWCNYWELRGASVSNTASTGTCPGWAVSFNGAQGETSILRRFIETSVKDGGKFIRQDYLIGSRETRMQLLAGLLDGDGHTDGKKPGFEIAAKSDSFARQIAFLARSLGFYASVTRKIKRIKSTGFSGEYSIVLITGDMSTVPTIQKRAAKRTCKKDPLLTSFEIEPLGEGDYFGFVLDGNHRYLLGDFTVTHNTYSAAHFALLDYLAGPQETATSLVTTKFDALKTRLWGDLMIAIQNARIREIINAAFRTVSSSNEMKFYSRADISDQKFLIHGVAIDRGDVNAGKIRGHHVPRRRIIVDEAQDVSDGIYLAFDNAMTGGTFKGVLLTNPVEKQSKYGEWSKPKEGWGSIEDSTLFWETKHGIALHLDGRQSPNVKAKKTINPNIMTWEYFQNLDLSTVAGWMFGIGFFPPDGMVAKIWPSNTVDRAKRSEHFDFAATPVAALDPAFDSDDCVFIAGEIGSLRDGKPCCCARESIVIQTKVGPGFLEKDFQIARECIRLCKERGIQPENFIMDITGNARGVYAIMRNEWAPMPGRGQVQGIYYGGEATERPLRTDDPLGANEQVKRFVTELWFRASYLARDGMLCGLDNIDPRTIVDLDARLYIMVQESDGKRMVAETKKDLRARIGRSPDFGDCFNQFAELMVRKGLLGEKLGGGSAMSSWDQMRARAIRSQKRFTHEFSHGDSQIQK